MKAARLVSRDHWLGNADKRGMLGNVIHSGVPTNISYECCYASPLRS